MPIYEYECLPNKHRFEVIQKFDEAPISHCTVCGEPVQKLLSPPSIQFKGTGWYITDYARKGSTEGESKSGAAGESSSKTDTSEKKTGSADSASTPK